MQEARNNHHYCQGLIDKKKAYLLFYLDYFYIKVTERFGVIAIKVLDHL